MNWTDEIILIVTIVMIVTVLITGELSSKEAHAQKAVDGVNGAFGGVSQSLRGVLDVFSSIDDFLQQLACHVKGMFGGYDNLPEGSICL